MNTAKLIPAYKNLIGWKPHFDTSEIDIDTALVNSESGEYFQEKHPALRLDYISATLPANRLLDEYLNEKVELAITGIFNDVIQYRHVNQYGKTLLEQSTLLNRQSWINDRIVNHNRFVGFQIKILDATGVQAIINEIGLQLDGAQALTMYLFHSTKEDAVATFDITTINTSTAWKKVDHALSSAESAEFYGGVFILGYYQNDLSTQAVNYSNFNWDAGECSTCDGGRQFATVWRSIRQNFFVYPVYFPAGSFEVGKMPDLKLAMFNNTTSWGLNLRLSVRCDLTDFFITNKFAFKNLLSLKVANIILKEMRVSTETNYVNDHLSNIIIREVEGDKETNYLNISQQYDRELKAVTFNISGINHKCLGCSTDKNQPIIGAL